MTDETVRLKREVRELQQALEAERNKPARVETVTQTVEIRSAADKQQIESLRQQINGLKRDHDEERKRFCRERTKDQREIDRLKRELQQAQSEPRQRDIDKIKRLEADNRRLSEQAEYHRRLKQ